MRGFLHVSVAIAASRSKHVSAAGLTPTPRKPTTRFTARIAYSFSCESGSANTPNRLPSTLCTCACTSAGWYLSAPRAPSGDPAGTGSRTVRSRSRQLAAYVCTTLESEARSATTAGMTGRTIALGICPRKMVRNLSASAWSTARPTPPPRGLVAAAASSGAICCWKKSTTETRSFVSVAPFTADCDLTVSEMTRYTAASFAFHELTGSAAC